MAQTVVMMDAGFMDFWQTREKAYSEQSVHERTRIPVPSSDEAYKAAPESLVYSTCMNRVLIVVGVLIALAGIFWKQISALPFFKLPGDIVLDRPGLKVFFPITTMIVISLLVSLILWIFRR